MKARLFPIVGLFFLVGCPAETPAPAPPPSVTPTPPPSLETGNSTRSLGKGKARYHLVMRSEGGVVYVPLSVETLQTGKGQNRWTALTAAPVSYQPEHDRFVSGRGGSRGELQFDAVFPGSPQSLEVTVDYGSAPLPPRQRFRLSYYALSVPDLASKVYVGPRIVTSEEGIASRADRFPLGLDRLKGVEVGRWLASGYLLRDPGEVKTAEVELPGP